MHEIVNPSTVDEIKKAIAHLRFGKAPGQDGIPPEIYKVAETTIIPWLHALFTQLWNEGEVPQDFKDAQITCIYKKKGDRSDCNNYRGISLLSIAGKILARVLLERLKLHIAEGNISESQTGFRSNRGTTDCIFTIRMIQEKCRKQNQHFYSVFFDLTKAFDSVDRNLLWSLLERIGCPPNFTRIIRSFHEGMCGRVSANGSLSAAFLIAIGLKQGCMLAPFLFILFYAAML